MHLPYYFIKDPKLNFEGSELYAFNGQDFDLELWDGIPCFKRMW